MSLLLILTSFSTVGQPNVVGYYSSQKAELGFFVTEIQLNEDMSFKYEFSGDLAYDKGVGEYYLENRMVFLDFAEPKLDSAETILNALSGGSSAGRPKKLLYKNGKLRYFDKDDRLVKNNYLRRRKGQELIWRGE